MSRTFSSGLTVTSVNEPAGYPRTGLSARKADTPTVNRGRRRGTYCTARVAGTSMLRGVVPQIVQGSDGPCSG